MAFSYFSFPHSKNLIQKSECFVLVPHNILRGEAIEAVLKQNCHTVNIREDGVTLIRGTFRYPSLDEKGFYRELAQNCETWLRTSLAPKAAQEYAQDPSAKKRFFFPSYEYRFEVKTVSQSESEITCLLTVSLTRRHSTQILSLYESQDRFRLPDLTLLPARRKIPRPKRIGHPISWLKKRHRH